MKYLILVYRDPPTTGPGHEELRRDLDGSGTLIVAELLADPSLTKRVRVGAVADGPLPGTGEHLTAFYLVECETVECALGHAGALPEATAGRVEVRPVLGRGGLEM